jgi:hypothetical protein
MAKYYQDLEITIYRQCSIKKMEKLVRHGPNPRDFVNRMNQSKRSLAQELIMWKLLQKVKK